MSSLERIVAGKWVNGEQFRAEYFCGTGRLIISSGAAIRAEWFPPDSWFAIASVSARSGWGTHPDVEDLEQLIANFLAKQFPDEPQR
ncbi:hypothetical protein P3T18_003062 [Paraburkholderia sp. GAS199]|uniref:hypothetical protein n=1 Tax=Paraburkholderia sp. GAS199 TaxID=3035126 RepID=UPI003D1DD1DA